MARKVMITGMLIKDAILLIKKKERRLRREKSVCQITYYEFVFQVWNI